ncbi:MAG: STAS domain-containing protein [Clostridia bacterium]|nr:STAS domain-containing protein [Clostridia bacterium]
MPVNVRYEAREGCLWVRLSGELGHHEAITLMARLSALVEDHLPARTELDLSGLEFMDSSGIAVVVQTARKCQNCGGKLTVTGTPPQAKKVLTCAGIHRLVDIR